MVLEDVIIREAFILILFAIQEVQALLSVTR